MSPESLKIFILCIWGLREALTKFNPILSYGHTFIRKGSCLNFNYISHTMTDSFVKKFTLSTGVHIFGT